MPVLQHLTRLDQWQQWHAHHDESDQLISSIFSLSEKCQALSAALDLPELLGLVLMSTSSRVSSRAREGWRRSAQVARKQGQEAWAKIQEMVAESQIEKEMPKLGRELSNWYSRWQLMEGKLPQNHLSLSLVNCLNSAGEGMGRVIGDYNQNEFTPRSWDMISPRPHPGRPRYVASVDPAGRCRSADPSASGRNFAGSATEGPTAGLQVPKWLGRWGKTRLEMAKTH